jgi:hypothetical protein
VLTDLHTPQIKTNYWIYEYIKIIRPENGEARSGANNRNAENYAGKRGRQQKN